MNNNSTRLPFFTWRERMKSEEQSLLSTTGDASQSSLLAYPTDCFNAIDEIHEQRCCWSYERLLIASRIWKLTCLGRKKSAKHRSLALPSFSIDNQCLWQTVCKIEMTYYYFLLCVCVCVCCVQSSDGAGMKFTLPNWSTVTIVNEWLFLLYAK